MRDICFFVEDLQNLDRKIANTYTESAPMFQKSAEMRKKKWLF